MRSTAMCMRMASITIGETRQPSIWRGFPRRAFWIGPAGVFYTGMSGNTPAWNSDITQKAAVLTDQRELYPVMFGTDCPADQKIIAQGGAVYDKPLNRYLMATWGCATHEFYEAPQPWGPWSHFLSNDFGPLRLLQNRGQYGTSIPSKFISADGQTVYLQSNVCCSGNSYTFSLRKLYLQAYAPELPANSLAAANLALSPGTRAISKSTHFGSLCGLNCSDQISSGALSNSEDDYDEESKTVDWWGYTWPQPYNINQVIYTTGTMFSNGGWYASDLRVQVRQNFQWIDVAGATVTPAYPYSSQAYAARPHIPSAFLTHGETAFASPERQAGLLFSHPSASLAFITARLRAAIPQGFRSVSVRPHYRFHRAAAAPQR